MLIAAITGFLTGFMLILAIGAQNAFVLRQGLARSHVFWLCLLFSVSDAVLIVAGVMGFAAVVEKFPSLPWAMAIAGAGFLFVYGATRLWAAWEGEYEMQLSGRTAGLWVTLTTGLAFTWLNPHVYLDTVGLIGAVSTRYDNSIDLLFYTFGAVVSSFIFFFSLGYGARFLAPIMQSAKAWRRLDVIIGLTMWSLAIKLLFI